MRQTHTNYTDIPIRSLAPAAISILVTALLAALVLITAEDDSKRTRSLTLAAKVDVSSPSVALTSDSVSVARQSTPYDQHHAAADRPWSAHGSPERN